MIPFIDWMITLSDLLLSGNPAKINAARMLIDARCFVRTSLGDN